MATGNNFDVIIIGGSYAGLSAAMALGRSLKSVLVIDSRKPCNRQTPHSHNFLTQDGSTPAEIAARAKEQVAQYDTVQFFNGLASTGKMENGFFEISLNTGEIFSARKLLFATGVTDVFPDIPGFADCWGISLLHCPYCHGYEVKQETMGVLANGDMGFELTRLIHNWSGKLTLYTNGKSTLSEEQAAKLEKHAIRVVEKEISHFIHNDGYIAQVVFKNDANEPLKAMFARPGFTQHCAIPQQLGCTLTEQGYIKVDDLQRTSIYGVYAAGDNTTPFRAVATAIAAGSKASAMINRELIEESF